MEPASGALNFDDGLRIDPRQPLSAFSPGVERSRRRNAKWTWIELDARMINGTSYAATLTFEGERLFSISLKRGRAGTGYETWSREEEDAVIAADTRWLTESLGEKRSYPWGTASAGFDERSATAYLVIRYV